MMVSKYQILDHLPNSLLRSFFVCSYLPAEPIQLDWKGSRIVIAAEESD